MASGAAARDEPSYPHASSAAEPNTAYLAVFRCMLQARNSEALKVVPALIKSLEDAQSSVRRSAAISLGYCGSEAAEAIPALEERQQDPDPRVREAAKTALERIQG